MMTKGRCDTAPTSRISLDRTKSQFVTLEPMLELIRKMQCGDEIRQSIRVPLELIFGLNCLLASTALAHHGK